MSVRSAQAVTVTFFTETGADADSLPTAELVLNGADNASATVTHVSTGRYTAAVTLPTLAMGDIVEIAVSATVASAAEKFVAWRDTADVALSSAGGVTLADGVAHGGTPGSSTATLAMQRMYVSTPNAESAVIFKTTSSDLGWPALMVDSSHGIGAYFKGEPASGIGFQVSGGQYGMQVSGGIGAAFLSGGGGNAGIFVEGGESGAAIELWGPYSTPGPVVLIDATAGVAGLDGGPGIQIRAGAGHGISIAAAGSGKKALLLSGDAATDALAIAAGAGSPVDVFNADGSVNAALTETGLDAVDDSELTAAPVNFRQRLRWLCQRFGTKGAKTKSGTSGTIVVKTAAGATATTQNYTDDGAGNQTQDNAS